MKDNSNVQLCVTMPSGQKIFSKVQSADPECLAQLRNIAGSSEALGHLTFVDEHGNEQFFRGSLIENCLITIIKK